MERGILPSLGAKRLAKAYFRIDNLPVLTSLAPYSSSSTVFHQGSYSNMSVILFDVDQYGTCGNYLIRKVKQVKGCESISIPPQTCFVNWIR